VNELSQTQLNNLNATFLFEPHCHTIQDHVFPPDLLINLRQEIHTEHHCSNPYIQRHLRRFLPFGHYLTNRQKDEFFGDQITNRLIVQARNQFLFWYLARSGVGRLRDPVNHLTIFYEADQFWFNHVASNHAHIIQRLLHQHPTFFLERFTLTHMYIQFDVGELRLVTNRAETHPEISDFRAAHSIVHIPGTTYHRSFEQTSWEITPGTIEPTLIDPPQPFLFPSGSLGDPDFQLDAREEIDYYLDLLPEDNDNSILSTLTYSPPPTLEPDPADQRIFEQAPSIIHVPLRRITDSQCCPCRGEFCECGYRIRTLLTPPNITLWAPGDKFLPSRD
jgi:hypothetical protein